MGLNSTSAAKDGYIDVTVRINNTDWEIRLVSGKKKDMHPTDDSYNIGLTEYLDDVIKIRKHMTESCTRSTVIHELIHAFIFSYGYTIEGEEAMCNFFGAHADKIMELTDEIMKGVKHQCSQ